MAGLDAVQGLGPTFVKFTDGGNPVTAAQLAGLPMSEWDAAREDLGKPANIDEFQRNLQNTADQTSRVVESNIVLRARQFADGSYKTFQDRGEDIEMIARRATPPAARMEEYRELYRDVFREIEAQNMNGDQAAAYAQEQFTSRREEINTKIGAMAEEYRKPDATAPGAPAPSEPGVITPSDVRPPPQQQITI